MSCNNVLHLPRSSSHRAKLAKIETDLIIESFQNKPSTSASTSFLEKRLQENNCANVQITRNNVISYETKLSQSERNTEIVEHITNTLENTENIANTESHQNINFKRFLAGWAVQECISQSSLRSLLDGIKQYTCKDCNFGIPSDPRSLLHTPRSTNINNCAGGQYYHFGLLEGIRNIIPLLTDNINDIKISVNIDGLPLSKSSQQQFWPILGSIVGFKQVFVIGIYYGKQKPSNCNEYLANFLQDAKVICEQGITLNTTNVSCTIDSIICDAPAKAFILQVKGHNGYSSCTKCITEGTYINGKICFPEKTAQLRTDEDFRLGKDENYHIGESALLEIPNFDIVRNIPLDYMHLVCLGVVRKILYMWLFGDVKVRLQSRKVQAISSQLENILKPYIPCEFVRKPRSLSFVKLWKATEFRSLLLYTGPVAFKHFLRKDLYIHFVTLHVAIRILCNTCSDFQNMMNYAQELLEYFVTTFILLYGIHNVSHNIHGLIHLVQDAKKFGPLDCFSAFKYENYLQTLKKLLKKHDKPLEQIVRRHMEYKQNNIEKAEKHRITSHFMINRQSTHRMGPLIEGCCNPQYKILRSSNAIIRIDTLADNCCGLTNGSIIEIKNIAYSEELGTDVCIGNEFCHTEDLYNIPCPSSVIGVYIVDGLSELKMWPIESIKTKYVKLPLNNKFAIFPLLHA